MSFTALHLHRGRLDATSEDLGCGWSWKAVHRASPPVQLSCPECGHGMCAKQSPYGLRFFAHYPGAPNCALAGESMEHHLLKLELAVAARTAGHHAQLEVRSPDGSWRADVLATTADGSFTMAWEAQLSTITIDGIVARTKRYRGDQVEACWVTTRAAHWLGHVPSIRVEAPSKDSADRAWKVRQGLARFAAPRGWQPAKAALGDFVAWAMSRRVVGHHIEQANGTQQIWWTAPAYQAAEATRRAKPVGDTGFSRELASAQLRQARRAAQESAHREAVRIVLTRPWNERMALIDAAFDWFRSQGALTRADSYYSANPGLEPTGIQLYISRAMVGLLEPAPALMRWDQFHGVVFVTTEADAKALTVTAPRGARIVVLTGLGFV